MTTLRSALRAEIALRQRRAAQFERGLFGEPAWDILLDLALARIEYRRPYITSVCAASGAPQTTALNHIGVLIEAGLAYREPDHSDGRRHWLRITDEGFARVAAVFEPAALVRAA